MHRVRTIFTGMSGSPYLSTMYFGSTDPLQTAQEAVTAVGNFWGAIDAQLSSTLGWTTDPEVAEVDIVTGEVAGSTATTPVSGVGALGNAVMALTTQALVRWRTGTFIAGREVRGRTFVPGTTTLHNLAGRPGGTLVTTITTAAAALVADVNADLYIWSRKNGAIGNVTSGTVWTEYASLRSRRD